MTLIDRILTGIGVSLAAFLAGIVLAAIWFAIPVGAAAPTPAPNLTLTKTATTAVVDLYDDVEFTITILNTGSAPSGYLDLTDTLQGVDKVDGWELGANTFSAGCDITDNVLTCAGIVPARIYPLGPGFPGIFADGKATVSVVALAMTCGTIENVARVTHQYEEETVRLRTNVAKVTIRGCETPTPTPTATPFATSTLIPLTPTPTVPAPSATAVPSTTAPTATATPFRLAPLPPNTGGGMQLEDSTNYTARKIIVVIAGLFGLGVVVYTLRRNV